MPLLTDFCASKRDTVISCERIREYWWGDNTEMERGTNCGTLDYPQPSSRSLAMKDPGCLINRPQSASTPRTINLPVRREVSSSSRILYRGHLNGMKLNLFVIAIGMIFLFIVFNLTVYNLLIQECRAWTNSNTEWICTPSINIKAPKTTSNP